jgi:TOMM system kinase/cyclase fusion protein
LDSVQAIRAALHGRYELLAQLGEGGFGTVYKARQLATGQFVAVKVLRLPEGSAARAHEKRIARFQREMQICAQMHHPNIVGLIDSGQAEAGIVYSIFEFVPGNNLSQVLAEEGGLDPGEARYLMMQALDALACAHAQGVVHRDLKPANIMIVPTGARRNALLLDFGIGALTQEARREEATRITLTNESVGTPSYSAPEQLRGLPPTRSSDLYSWGLVFLECLTGKRVIEGASVAEVVFKQLSHDPIPIPAMIVDHPLGALLRRVTAKDPARRDVTAEWLLRELEACDVSALRAAHLKPASDTAVTETVEIASGPNAGAGTTRLVEGERRQITAVCCAISASSTGPKAADMEELDQILGVQQERCVELARRFAGHVAGALGDSVLFYFGYPTAREDDAPRAARFAFAMVAEVRRQSAALSAERGLRVDLRVGIHTGLVVARELRDATSSGLGYVVGATPKLAARLSALAEPGGILVSDGTQRLLRRQFLLEESGFRAVEDSAAPVEVFALREGDPSPELQSLPLIGRDRELSGLLSRWGLARSGAGQTILVHGEPGIGKSRLVRELAEQLGDEAGTWLECRCAPDSAKSAFYPIVDLLDRMIDPRREVTPDGKVEKLAVMLSLYGFDLAEAMPLFTPLLSLPLPKVWAPLDVSPQKKREMTRNAVLSLLFEMAEKEAVALVVEDLQWADPSTIELLGQLIGEVASARVLAIFTARPEFTPPWSPTAVLQIQLGRLGRPEVEQMAAKITGGRALPAEALDQITSRTDGVPLFVEELILTMIEAGALAPQEGRYALAKPLSELSIPATLRDSLVARLDRLGRAKETAQVAAAIGREFTFELLRAVMPLDEAAVQDDLDQLVAAELVYRKRRLKNPAYLFKHALVRDAAYESMLKRSRREVHSRVAKALEERFPETVNDRPDLLALHHAAAEQKREAIGYAHKAAMGTLVRSAYLEAIAQAKEAIGWLHAIEDERERAEIELDLNGVITPALMGTRGFGSPEYEAILRRSQEIIDVAGGGPRVFPMLWALVIYHYVQNRREEARSAGERFLSLAERAGDISPQVAVLAILAYLDFVEGRFELARARAERAIDQYDTSAHRNHAFIYGVDSKASAHATVAVVLWFMGEPEASSTHAREALSWCEELNQAHTTGSILFALATLHHYRREPEKVVEITDRLRDLAGRHALPLNLAYGDLVRAWADRDVARGKQSLELILSAGQRSAFSYWSSIVAEIEAGAGSYDAALERLDECIECAAETGSSFYLSELHRLKGVYLKESDSAAR